MWKELAIATSSAFVGQQLDVLAIEGGERTVLFDMARTLRVAAGKPMIVIGQPSGAYPCSPDVTLDIDPTVMTQCPMSGIVGDVRNLPYLDHYFSVAFVSHVLEHLPNLDDARAAWRELWRVADTVLVAFPRKSNMIAILSSDHHLWVTSAGTELLVEERHPPYRRAIVRNDGAVIPV